MSPKPLIFRGVAHPPARAKRDHPSDLSAGELAAVAERREQGLPVFIEHDTATPPVGNVLTSWEGPRGELRVMASVDDPTTAKRVLDGELRGLSLGTDCIQATDGSVLSRCQKELSLCAEGRRAGTWIDTIGDTRVHSVAAFSKANGAQTRRVSLTS
jgi:hypothetical protein